MIASVLMLSGLAMIWFASRMVREILRDHHKRF